MPDLAERFDNALVTFSIFVAIVSAFAAFDLIDRILSAKRRTFSMLFITAFVIGSGLWSMHFIGMLAFNAGVPVTYDLPLAALSALLTVAASLAALYLITGRTVGKPVLFAGGLLIGAAFLGMHFVGMMSMKMPAHMTYRTFPVAMAVLIAMSIPFIVIFLAARYDVYERRSIPLRAKIIGGLLLAFIAAGMHYTAMSGVVITPIDRNDPQVDHFLIGKSLLAVFVGGFTLTIVTIVVAGAVWDRHRALRLAEDHKRRYMSLFENSPDMVICFDPTDDRVISANPAVYRITGYSEQELAAAAFRGLFASEGEMAAVREEYRHSAEDNKPRKLEAEIHAKDGSPLQLSLTVFPLDLDGKRYIYAIGSDITDRKQAESLLVRAKEEAERASRVKGDFLAVMSHEIRTPLNGIIGINQLLLETELTDKQREMLLVQERSGQALLRVINDVLDFSKIESGNVALSDELFHLKGTMQECLDSFAVQAGRKGIGLKLEWDPVIPDLLHGDPVRLRQIIVNLVGNAVKFTETGTVELSAELQEFSGRGGARQAVIEFKVSDTGIGIDPLNMHLLFLPFSQIKDRAKGRNDEGTGLGLAICKDLVELMGGKIWVDAGRKRGAAFGFRIPFRMMESVENGISG